MLLNARLFWSMDASFVVERAFVVVERAIFCCCWNARLFCLCRTRVFLLFERAFICLLNARLFLFVERAFICLLRAYLFLLNARLFVLNARLFLFLNARLFVC